MDRIVTIQLECGMTLVVEPIATVASAAVVWLLPVGAASQPPERDGHAAMLSELIMRGAGQLDSRQHSDALDRLGVQRSTDVQTHHLRIEATMLGDRLERAMPLLAAMVRQPALPEDALPAVRSLCLQTLDSLNDDPQGLVMLRLRERHLAPPFNRHGYGSRDVLEQAGIDELRATWQARCRPGGTIFGAAGAVDPKRVADQLNTLLAGWDGAAPEPAPTDRPARGYDNIHQSTAQVHIGLAYDAPPERDPSSMTERLAISVLSGSTSGRLFTEVRQKRSLCYSVGASYRAGRDVGFVSLYAGTTPQRAQETLDVCVEEIERLARGATREEYQRAVTGLKAMCIMQGESTPARAGALVYDQFRLGRARTLGEVAAAVDAVTFDGLNDHLAARQPGPFTVASIGPTPLRVGEKPTSQKVNKST